LLPPVWAIGRSPAEDVEIQGVSVPRGTLLFLASYVTHRHPDFWSDPEGFDPDRWTPEKVATHHRAQYFPFALGPRMCIGAGFAMMEGHLLLPMFLRRYRFDLAPGHRVEKEPLITLRPRYGMKMTLRRR
jgi:cytochrome P450